MHTDQCHYRRDPFSVHYDRCKGEDGKMKSPVIFPDPERFAYPWMKLSFAESVGFPDMRSSSRRIDHSWGSLYDLGQSLVGARSRLRISISASGRKQPLARESTRVSFSSFSDLYHLRCFYYFDHLVASSIVVLSRFTERRISRESIKSSANRVVFIIPIVELESPELEIRHDRKVHGTNNARQTITSTSYNHVFLLRLAPKWVTCNFYFTIL